METEEILRQRLTGQEVHISVCILVCCVATEVEREREGLGRWETPYLWQTQLLIIEFNLCFIPHVTFEEFLSVLEVTSCQSCFRSSVLLFWKWKSWRTWCFFCCVRLFTTPFFPPFVFLPQYSRTQYVRCTDFKQWTASGCLCGNKWRSAHCPLASPNSCSHCTFRRTWVGKRLWNHCVDPEMSLPDFSLHQIAYFLFV